MVDVIFLFLFCVLVDFCLAVSQHGVFVNSYNLDGNFSHSIFDDFFVEKTHSLLVGNGSSNSIIRVDKSNTYQKMIGYGACLTVSSAFLLNELKESDYSKYILYLEQIFVVIGINVIRISVASNDYIPLSDYYSYYDTQRGNFSIDIDKKYFIPVLLDIKKIKPDLKIIASPWSAPGWMKSNGELKGGILVDYDSYSSYFIRYLQEYKKSGITVDFMTLQNEPYFNSADYPCMFLDQPKFLGILKKNFFEESISTKLLIHDHNWNLESNVESVLSASLPELSSFIYGIAWHGYGGERYSQNVPIKKYETFGLHTFFTEITAWGKTEEREKNFRRDFRWSFQNILFGSTRNLGEVVLYYNLILDDQHGPTPRSDSLAFGLTTMGSSSDIWMETEIYSMSHISMFLRNGDFSGIYSETFFDGKWIDIDSTTQEEKNSDPNGPLESIAFFDFDRGIEVIVVLNPSWVDEVSFDVVFEDGYYVQYKLGTESAVTFVRKY